MTGLDHYDEYWRDWKPSRPTAFMSSHHRASRRWTDYEGLCAKADAAGLTVHIEVGQTIFERGTPDARREPVQLHVRGSVTGAYRAPIINGDMDQAARKIAL